MDEKTKQALQQFVGALAMQRAYLVAMFGRLSQDPKFDAEVFIEYLYMLQQNLPDPRSGITEGSGAQELKHLIEMTEDTLRRLKSE
jgi:hypothetical protein